MLKIANIWHVSDYDKLLMLPFCLAMRIKWNRMFLQKHKNSFSCLVCCHKGSSMDTQVLMVVGIISARRTQNIFRRILM
jgi:hypothetical protein